MRRTTYERTTMSKISANDAARTQRILKAVREVHDWRIATCHDRDSFTEEMETEWYARLKKAYDTP
jgi:hypothetical protein